MSTSSPKPAAAAVPDAAITSAIKASSELCSSILSDLAAPPTPTDAPPATTPAPSLADVRNDFVELTTFLGKEATALSLAFKPPISLAAVRGTLEKINALLLKLRFCLKCAPSSGALAKELNWTAQETVEAVQRLLDGSLAAYEAEGKQAKELREVNLRLTAQVWEKAEHAKQLSEDELQATRRQWQNVLGLLDDCLEEVKEMEDSSPAEEKDEEEDAEEGGDSDSDDGSDDFRSSHPLSDSERARVTAAHMLLRIGRLLLQRLITSTAPKLSAAAPGYGASTFLATSSRLVQSLSAAADDLAEGLEPPQTDAGELAEAFGAIGKELSVAIEEAVEGADVKESEGKWQAMWRIQVDKLQKLGS
ncbi:hypothetical protein RQP46_006796 [Phenoliferia psychrophenolica]